jgi:hypothetical protein
MLRKSGIVISRCGRFAGEPDNLIISSGRPSEPYLCRRYTSSKIKCQVYLQSLAEDWRVPAENSEAHVGENWRFQNVLLQKKSMVGARGFEPRTPCAQGRCATRLRYAPTLLTSTTTTLLKRRLFRL